ncbi:MAG TPA: hypothetical protein VL001_12105 [Candidimonas sp.]|nr:hypothetical protein [Candidimonas sp.]
MGEVLVIFGFLWMVSAALIGLYLGAIHDAHLQKLEDIAREGTLASYHQRLDFYKWRVTTHAHAFLFSVVVVLIGLVIDRTNYSDPVIDVIGYGLIAAPVLWTIGGIRRIKPLMGIGDLLLLLGIVFTVVGLTKIF